MNAFVMELYDAAKSKRIDNVASLIAEDRSGSFGIQAHHAKFMTVLIFGLFRYRLTTDEWFYLAMPGGVLYFNNNVLTISTRHFVIDSDYDRISQLLKEQLVNEEETLYSTLSSLKKIEQSMLTRLLQLQNRTH